MVGLAVAGSPNVVLITLDTTRADALHCDVNAAWPLQITTPTLCGLAADGLSFARFYSHAPTTLSAHASLMTGRDPHEHGVPRNGFPVAGSVPTLAERFGASGYDTLAVVGATPLEQAMGLHRGFRVYDDDLSELVGQVFQRRADAVTDRALKLVDERSSSRAPMFLFVHYFDAHAPYDAPEPFRERFVPAGVGEPPDVAAGQAHRAAIDGDLSPSVGAYFDALYLGEIAYVDNQLERLLSGLAARGALDDALVVITADHGESLSRDGIYAYSHGSSVGAEVLRVPLIMRAFGDVPIAQGGRVVHRQAPMSHLASTLEVLVGLQPTFGPDIYAMVRPGPVDDTDGWPSHATWPVHLEATRPRGCEGATAWNNLLMPRGVLAGGYAMTASPCFDRPWAHDTGFGFADAGPLASTLTELARAWDAAAPAHRVESLAPATRRALEALGYLEPGQ